MITTQDKSYIQTKNMLISDQKPKGILGELAEWISDEYGIKVLNVCFEYITPGGEKRPRIEVVLESRADVTKFQKGDLSIYDEIKQRRIADKYIELNSKSKNRFFWKKENRITNLNKLFVIFSTFAPIAQSDANNQISNEVIVKIRDKYSDYNVWEIAKFFSMVTIFFYTEEQAEMYRNSELLADIEKEYLSILEGYDRFGYYQKYGFNIRVDSKENFDKNYESNWYYYYK